MCTWCTHTHTYTTLRDLRLLASKLSLYYVCISKIPWTTLTLQKPRQNSCLNVWGKFFILHATPPFPNFLLHNEIAYLLMLLHWRHNLLVLCEIYRTWRCKNWHCKSLLIISWSPCTIYSNAIYLVLMFVFDQFITVINTLLLSIETSSKWTSKCGANKICSASFAFSVNPPCLNIV